ncbi:MAG: MOSC domain-containing protein [Verrucomicrobia bacterium]|nr:MOSC domain-containing protein [Verrucomicrobiota bacterium]
MHLSGLFIYPVKSLRGCAVGAADLDELGLVGDRRFMVVDSQGRFLTQRAHPQMTLIATSLSPDTLTLSAQGAGICSVPRVAARESAPPLLRRVSVWNSDGLTAEDCGDAAAEWLAACLRVKCRLVRAGPAFHRPVLKPGRALPSDVVGFADAYPFLLISEASLSDLNQRLAAGGEAPLPMDRFRPNLVVAGGAAYDEDTWPRVRIGSIALRAGGPCARCAVTTTDQLTATRGREPLRTLATYRRDAEDPTDVNFGQNFFHESKRGILRVGDPVEILAAARA